jgi:hypothetical protein
MTPPAKGLKSSRLLFALTGLILGAVAQVSHPASPRTFTAALIHPGDTSLVLTLFPGAGHKMEVPLPAGLPRSVTVNAFSADGTAIFLREADYWSSEGILKIEFRPPRKAFLPGTTLLQTIWNLAVLPSGLMVASGNSKHKGECGTYEVDPVAGTVRTLRAGAFPGCGGGGGPISPDGKRVLNYSAKGLSIINLVDGAAETIDGIPGGTFQTDISWLYRASWSPDGQWISVVLKDGKIVLVDASNTSKRRHLGSLDGPPAIWSPDSKQLLLSKSEPGCRAYFYFQSLEIVDIATGKRQIIQSSHCEVGPGWFGWLDLDAVR